LGLELPQRPKLVADVVPKIDPKTTQVPANQGNLSAD
jgi:hypothetical protein